MRTFETPRMRTGSSALEFALVTPLLTVLLLGMMDYGWFYARETMVVGAGTAAVRAGSLLRPLEDDETGCTPCETVTAAHAAEGLREAGIDPTGILLQTQVVNVGTSCGVVLDFRVPHEPLIGFVPLGAGHDVHVAANAPYVDVCP